MKVAHSGTAYGPTHLTLPFLGLNRTLATNSLSLLSLQNDHSHSLPRIVGIVFISGLQMIATWDIRLAIVHNGTSVVLLMMKYD